MELEFFEYKRVHICKTITTSRSR